MPTFLVGPKMAPELAARIEASVHGGTKTKRGGVLAPRQAVVLRFAIAAIVMGLAGSVFAVQKRGKERVEGARAAVLALVEARGAKLTQKDRAFVERTESWLTRLSGPYEGDLVASSLSAPAGLSEVLQRPAVYVRGAVAALHATTGVLEAAATSSKDPFVLCLLDPPAGSTEKALLPKVHSAYSDGHELAARTANVEPLYAPVRGLPFFQDAWTQRVKTAVDEVELAKLGHDAEHAPLEQAARAAASSLLVVVMDEPPDGPGPTELDGERAHPVRVNLVDLKSETVLLRLRTRSDPAWISESNRPRYATGLDGCRLALDVRKAAGM